jgi:SAM-dependent methyltransferase
MGAMRRLAAVLLLFFAAGSAQAQKAPAPSAYEPTSGQEGKDVVWVPTRQMVVDKMLDLARVGPSDFVMDLGSGDGRTVITAAKRGAHAVGIEFNPDLVRLARRHALDESVADRVTFVTQDLFQADLARATVITLFLLPDLNLKLRSRILALKPGTRIVSNTFGMGDWKEDERAELTRAAGCNSAWCTPLLWIVPAKVAGSYKVPQGEVTLTQEFQVLSGSLRTKGETFELQGKVVGEEIRFTAGGRKYVGRKNGETLELR